MEVSAWRADVGEHSDNSCRVHGRRHSLSQASARKVWKERSLPPRQVRSSGRVCRTARLRCPIWELPDTTGPPALQPGHTPGSTRPWPWDQTRGRGAGRWLGLCCIVTERQLDGQGERNTTRTGSGPAANAPRRGLRAPSRQVSLTAHTAQPGRGLQPLRPHSHATP